MIIALKSSLHAEKMGYM